jgi:indole-3-glycerol phosphate synthase
LPETQASRRAADVLARIVDTKRGEVERLGSQRERITRAASEAAGPRDLRQALARPGEVTVIAEVKRRSPGAGVIRPDLDPAALAGGYQSRGAAAVSVLTDADYFGGSLDDLRLVRGAVGLPVLRKDFVIDELQVAEARGAGADAVLLIVRILDDASLARLSQAALDHGLTALVEVHDEQELERALAAGAGVIGVNNRDLATFTTDLEVTLRLLPRIPGDVVVVSESGIRRRADVERLGEHGVHAVLVGESVLRAADPAEAVASLTGCPRRERADA